MPVQGFNQIETEEYRINPTMLIVRKDVIANGKSAAKIFDENNIEGVIVETLQPAEVGLSGNKPKACFRFRIQAAQLTTDEIAKKEEAKKLAEEEQAKKDAAAAQEGAKDAPPPPETLPTLTPMTRGEMMETKPTGRQPGQLPRR